MKNRTLDVDDQNNIAIMINVSWPQLPTPVALTIHEKRAMQEESDPAKVHLGGAVGRADELVGRGEPLIGARLLPAIINDQEFWRHLLLLQRPQTLVQPCTEASDMSRWSCHPTRLIKAIAHNAESMQLGQPSGP